MTSESKESAVSVSSSLFSLALMLVASAVCFGVWRDSSAASYLVASVGFLFLALLWYRSPTSIKALLGPVGGRLTPLRRFSRLDILLTFVSYSLTIVAITLRLLEWHRS